MRLRNVPGAVEKIKENSAIVIPAPKEQKGKWQDIFGNNNPIHIEIGMGKGQFIFEMAKRNPEVNFIGIERFDSVLLRAMEKLIDEPQSNVRLLKEDARFLGDFFELGEVALIYLNFSDPWPKDRHAKRRLTHKNFLDLYKSILHKDGEIWFKSDNRGLFEFSVISFNQYGLEMSDLSLNLHENEPEFNVRTEYEVNWSGRGYPIYRVVVRYK
jgi:tRNA (guanine-N7-)-methyltransferase